MSSPIHYLRNGVQSPTWELLTPQMRRKFRTKRLISGRQMRRQIKAQRRASRAS